MVIVAIADWWAVCSDAMFAVRPTYDVSVQQGLITCVCLLLRCWQCTASMCCICVWCSRNRAVDNRSCHCRDCYSADWRAAGKWMGADAHSCKWLTDAPSQAVDYIDTFVHLLWNVLWSCNANVCQDPLSLHQYGHSMLSTTERVVADAQAFRVHDCDSDCNSCFETIIPLVQSIYESHTNFACLNGLQQIQSVEHYCGIYSLLSLTMDC